MSHHSEDITPEMRDLVKQMQLGATKQFPEGHLNQQDEGEIRLAVTHESGKVIVHFGKPIAWVGFGREQAIVLADLLIKHAAALGN